MIDRNASIHAPHGQRIHDSDGMAATNLKKENNSFLRLTFVGEARCKHAINGLILISVLRLLIPPALVVSLVLLCDGTTCVPQKLQYFSSWWSKPF
jgi:hypothetical protein